MCTNTDSKSKQKRQSMDENNEVETVKGKSVLLSKSLLEDDEEEEEPGKSSHVSIADDVRDTESEPVRGFAFDRSDFATDFTTFSEAGLCSNLGVCSGPLFVEGRISDQIELMTQCRHPMELFSLFNDEHDDREGVESSTGLPMAYALPKRCEYCGSESTNDCPDDCQRPRSLFRKKRPPFCPPGPGWDPRTEEEIRKPINEKKAAKDEPPVAPPSPFSAFSGFFLSPGSDH